MRLPNALAAIASLCLLSWTVPASAAPDARFPHLDRLVTAKPVAKVRHVRKHRRHARRHHHRRVVSLHRFVNPKAWGKRARYQRLYARRPVTRSPSIAGLPRFIFGRFVCAVNVNRALAAHGIRGTGSALAKSFLHWGRPSAPVPGAVAIYNRGRSRQSGHVAIVSRVVNGKVYVWNPGRHGWREIVYGRPAIAYRVP